MVVCKFFQQGTCKFGHSCRFEHTFNGQSTKPYGENKSVAMGVAEEVLIAERGGQWPLSCFGPFKEQPSIPGMDDISPDEVRWEMYQAQKNGTVDQCKVQFQQLCEEMKAKREALKNPTHDTAALLEKLQKGNRDNTFGKSNFPLPSSLNTNISAGNVFATKTFGNSTNSFAGGFNSAANTSSSIFGRSNTTNSTVFGGKPSFGGTPFGGQSTTTSIFGDTSKSNASIFGGSQYMPTFGSAAQSTAFGFDNTNNSQPIFSQSNNVFANSQSTTSAFGGNNTTTSAFGGNNTTTSPFSNVTVQSNASPFAMTNPSATNLFSTTPAQQNASIFGGSASVNSSVGTSSILRQPKPGAAFGGAPLFNAAPVFGGNTTGSAFGGQPSFSSPRNLFESNATNATFGSSSQPINSFSALSTAQNIFTSTQNTNSPFGPISSASNNNVFGSNQSTKPVFENAFNTSTPIATPFLQSSVFGSSMTGNNSNAFGSTTNSFLNVNNPPKLNESNTAFGTIINNPFAPTTVTTTMSNPFLPQSQQSTTSTSSSTPGFGGINFACKVAEIIDESIYTPGDQLTDDEKQMYLSNQFIFGKIPLKPPSIELR